MRAVIVRAPGDEGGLGIGDVPPPALGPADVRIQVSMTAVNRADLLQRQGLYPPPPGASAVLGLECAGEVVEVGAEVQDMALGARVMALLAGGGYAEEVVVHHGAVLPVPAALDDAEAAAFPEVFFTAFSNLFLPRLGALQPAESVLVHGGGGGVGTAAIVLLRETGNACFVTVGSADKARRCEALGATAALDYTASDFAETIRAYTGDRGVDVVIDHVGAAYLERNLRALAIGGRLVEIGVMGGAYAEVDLAGLLMRRQSIIGSTLRSRPPAEKTAIVRAFRERFGAALDGGRLRPPIDLVLPLAEVADAHRRMQASAHFGKIVLRVR